MVKPDMRKIIRKTHPIVLLEKNGTGIRLTDIISPPGLSN